MSLRSENLAAAATLEAAFPAHDGEHEHDDALVGIIISVADEIECASEALDSDACFAEVAVRIMKRAVDRLRLSLEVEDQVHEPVATRPVCANEIEPDSVLWFAPTGTDGRPDFTQAREATQEEMKRRGWVWFANVSAAIGILCGPAKHQPVDLATEIDNEPPVEHESGTHRVSEESVEAVS